MSITQSDLERAKESCGNIQLWYNGPDPVRYGMTHEDPEESSALIDEAWLIWSSFTISYVKAMLATLAGYKKMRIESQIAKDCTPLEMKGAKTAMQVFWRGEISRRGGVHKFRHLTMSGLQHRIFEDDGTNRTVFDGVAQRMEKYIDHIVRTRRMFLDNGIADREAIAADRSVILCSPRPRLLDRDTRNGNFDGCLF